MIRTALLALIVAGSALGAPAALAQTAPPENDDSRFTFHRADDGYLRLDGRTGQVSLCNRRPAGWLCQTLPDDRIALEAEIARLQSDNAALKKELLSRNLPLPGSVKPDPAPRGEEPRLRLPSDPELNQMMSFLEKVWRRLVEMIVNVQKDLLRKT
jgi:hypothetical protein